MNSSAIFKEGIEALGLPNSVQKSGKMMAYIEEIKYWNHRYRMIADCENIVSCHVLDSLAGVDAIKSFSPKLIADVGSGAGFPGIPLAIWMEEINFVLIERSKRRAGFLHNVIITLGLSNVLVIEKPANQASADGPFDLIVFRAWAKIDDSLMKMLTPLLAIDGTIIAYKGRLSTAKKELKAINSARYTEIRPVAVPGLARERCLGIIKGISEKQL